MKLVLDEIKLFKETFEKYGIELEIADEKYIINNTLKAVKKYNFKTEEEILNCLYSHLNSNRHMFVFYLKGLIIDSLNNLLQQKIKNKELLSKVYNHIIYDVYSVFEILDIEYIYGKNEKYLKININDGLNVLVNEANKLKEYKSVSRLIEADFFMVGSPNVNLVLNLKKLKSVKKNTLTPKELNEKMIPEDFMRMAYFYKEVLKNTDGANFLVKDRVGFILNIKKAVFMVNKQYIAKPTEDGTEILIVLKRKSDENLTEWLKNVYGVLNGNMDKNELENLIKIMHLAYDKRKGKVA